MTARDWLLIGLILLLLAVPVCVAGGIAVGFGTSLAKEVVSQPGSTVPTIVPTIVPTEPSPTSMAIATPKPSVAPTGVQPSTGIPIPPGTTLPAGSAVIVREIRWDTNPVEVWVWYTGNTETDLLFSDAHDGVAGHVRDGWTSDDGNPWSSMATEACKEAQAVTHGSLGVANVIVQFQGAEVPAVCDP